MGLPHRKSKGGSPLLYPPASRVRAIRSFPCFPQRIQPRHRYFVMLQIPHKFDIEVTGKHIALATMGNLLFGAANAEIPAGVAATLEKTIRRRIPAALAQRVFLDDRFRTLVLADPPLSPVPPHHRLRRPDILPHRNFIRSTRGAIDATGRHPDLTHPTIPALPRTNSTPSHGRSPCPSTAYTHTQSSSRQT